MRLYQVNIGKYWLKITTWKIHCKIANFVAQQAALNDSAYQATLAFVADTKLLVYNVFLGDFCDSDLSHVLLQR